MYGGRVRNALSDAQTRVSRVLNLRDAEVGLSG